MQQVWILNFSFCSAGMTLGRTMAQYYLLCLPVDLRVVLAKPWVAKAHLVLPKICDSKDSTFRVVSEP